MAHETRAHHRDRRARASARDFRGCPIRESCQIRDRDPAYDCRDWARANSFRCFGDRLSRHLKHNRAGKGLGVKLIYSEAALKEHLASGAFEDAVNGIMLIQRYIKAPEPLITRVEFIGGKLFYAVRVDTSRGFEL